MSLSIDDMAAIRARAAEIAARATPPDERRIRTLQKIFGPVYAPRTGGEVTRQSLPAAGHSTSQTGHAA